MKDYIGKKIRGFRFEDRTDGVGWLEVKQKHINEVGIIIYQCDLYVLIKFENVTWEYPISLIEQHLVEEEIPQLGQGVLMEVSDDGVLWVDFNIIARLADGKFIDDNAVIWKHARPIQQIPKYTHAELVEKLGHDFEIIK